MTDLAVGATGDSSRGAVNVLMMNSNGTVKSSLKIGSETNGGPILASGDSFGFSVASLGDLNRDGVMDLAVGARGDDTGGVDHGAVYALTLNTNGTVSSSTKLANGINGGPTVADGDHFGFSLAPLGDLDGDGVADLAVGTEGDDTGGLARGALHLLYLNAATSVVSEFSADPQFKYLSDITTDGVNFYVSGGDANGAGGFETNAEIFRLPVGGGSASVISGAFNPNEVATDGTYVYWIDPNGDPDATAIFRVPVGGGTRDKIFSGFAAGQPIVDGGGLAYAANNILVSADQVQGQIHSMTATNPVTNLTQLGSDRYGGFFDREHFSSIDVENGVIYIADSGQGSFGDTPPRVQSIPLAGGSFTNLFVGTLPGFSPRGITVANNTIYLTTQTQVLQMPITGGTPTVVSADSRFQMLVGLTYLNGALYVTDRLDNNSAKIWKVELIGARDFGDAPDTNAGTGTGNYQTLIANNGPSHSLSETQTTLFLGARVDAESSPNANTRSNGDDTTTLPDDEDGLIEPVQDLILTVGTAPVVRVRATNTTGSTATLYGWIDFNRDGVFDNATERTSIAVPTATNNSTFTLTFPTIPTSAAAGTTYARFRLSTDVAAANATGAATGGEVEDYSATITLASNGTANSAKTKKIASDTNGGPTLTNGDYFGRSVASLGDLDGDGVIDLAVGADRDDTGGSALGAVYIQFMNSNGTVKSNLKLASGLNGSPTLVGVNYFGWSLAALGDMDGDGVSDLAVGATSDSSARGAVHVLHLNSNGTVKNSLKLAGNTNGGPTLVDFDRFGSSLTSLGDLDGDGVIDLAVGARGDATGGSLRGAVHLLLLNADGTAKSRTKLASGMNGSPTLADGDFFGASVAPLGDLDGDGVGDVAVGAYHDDTNGTGRGAVYVLFLNSNGTVKSNTKLASATNGGPTLTNYDFFGRSVTSLGDLDGDGVSDLAVGADGDDTGGTARGAVHVLFLNTNGTVKSKLKLASDTNGGPAITNIDLFGTSVVSLGDLV